MMQIRRWTLAAVALAATTAFGALAAPAAAQDAERDRGRTECRCVDRSGEEIDGCRCLRTVRPEIAELTATLEALRPGRAVIGVQVSDADEDGPAGVLIQDVSDDSPAAEAGLRAGDVVVRVNGTSVLEPADGSARDAEEDRQRVGGFMIRRIDSPVSRFVRLVGDLEPGEEAEIGYLRDGRERTATVVPKERAEWTGFLRGPGTVEILTGEPGVEVLFDRDRFPFDADEMRARGFFFRSPEGEGSDEGEARAWTFGDGGEGFRLLSRGFDPCFSSFGEGRTVVVSTTRCVDGAQLQELNPGLAEYFEVERGVLVTEVSDDSTLGLRPGDVITAIDGRTVEDASDVRRVLGSYETDEPVTLTIVRRGEEMDVRGTRR